MRQYYFPDIFKKIHIATLSAFKDIQIAKYAEDGTTVINYRAVPLSFAHKGKEISMAMKKDHRSFSSYLPRLALMINSMTPNPEKVRGGHLVDLCKYTTTGQDTLEKLYGGVPYKIGYTLSILAEFMGETSQILEQILPEFTPFKNVTIREFDFIPSFTRDIPITLTGVTPIFQEETEEGEIKRIEIDIDFEVDCVFYRPILTSDIIKTVNIDLIDSSLMPDITGNDLATFEYSVSGDDISDYVVITDEWTEQLT